MARTYDESKLLPITATSLECARTWVRFWLKDKPSEATAENTGEQWPNESLSDAEINAALELPKVTVNEQTYYRPHVVAGNLYKSNPRRYKQLAHEGFSHTMPEVDEMVNGWLAQGKTFDDQIPDGGLPESEKAFVNRSRMSTVKPPTW